ncbi:MAG TPA: tRNA (adenosine(37)-N6)-threonylcarbamoyltransferase complex ATPase subunit type 1 TsaE, partial [Gemmatimonadales bacterium]|nr:tRNA (adenosine(37)-N6)-threonylcarbamoyltransferase complex ATPase subunit type 1 TsaE [Gemmatimonadales bacterium]
DLGAGKTTLIQAIALGLDVAANATSPTYALVHRYEGRRGPVYHLDCYRLRHPDEACDLDWETLMQEGYAMLIEWPEKAGSYVPPAALRLRLSHVPENPDLRRLEILDATV